MSRIGKKPISVPSGVTVALQENFVTVKGPKGELSRALPSEMAVSVEDGTVTVTRPSDIPVNCSMSRGSSFQTTANSFVFTGNSASGPLPTNRS